MLATTWRLDSSTALFTWELETFWMENKTAGRSTYVEYVQLQLGHVAPDEGGGGVAVVPAILLHKLLVVGVYPLRRTKIWSRKSRNIHGALGDVDSSCVTVLGEENYTTETGIQWL